MANLNVRINHKFDSFSNWMNSDLVLNKGELAIAEIPSAQTESGLTPPAIGIKVGDGENKFSGLKWIQATAGDVHTWAKAAKKPEYTAEEISGLESYIAGQIQDTNTTYTFEFENDTLIVKHKEKVDEEYKELAKKWNKCLHPLQRYDIMQFRNKLREKVQQEVRHGRAFFYAAEDL